ncbi:MAG TPA: helix-turn-helix domain-containing protein [Bryobacteraceae bacterium]|nr:helix-turn-helix domain-containing protein [Bryobacteraceae bacterium]
MQSEAQVVNHGDSSIAVARPSDLLTPSQVARRLQVSSAWVRDHATRKQPRLKAVKVGKLLRFRPQDIEEFIRTWCQ